MSRQFRFGALIILFGMSCLGCGSKEAEGVPPGVNLPPPPDRDKGAKAAFTPTVKPEFGKLTRGGKAKVTVSATRMGYEGPIAFELSNVPANVTASSKGTLA